MKPATPWRDADFIDKVFCQPVDIMEVDRGSEYNAISLLYSLIPRFSRFIEFADPVFPALLYFTSPARLYVFLSQIHYIGFRTG